MGDMMPAVLTVGVGVALLVVLLLVALRPVQRFARASAALRAGVSDRVAVLHALADERRRGSI
jgi:hypothetical protein